MASEELQRALTVERYPRSAAYDQQWVVDNLMGPHPLWSVEALMQVMSLEPGRPGGSIGVIVPGLDLELGATLPPYLADRWVPDLATWDLVG